VIRCQLAHLEARCRQRGYTLEQVRPCIISQDGDNITVDETHPAYPRAKPGLAQKAANFAASAAKHVAAGMPQCSDEERERRFAICQGCEFFDGKACTKCGCPVAREKRFVSKLAWADSECPVGKWGKEAKKAVDNP
jgi:hypothetical protein